MCGIIGIVGKEKAKQEVKEALALLQNRGKDACGLTNGTEIITAKSSNELHTLSGNTILGHTLHAVVGNSPQPLKGEGTLVANCEIYNWKELAEKYQLEATNDAELLLKFLDKFYTNKLNELDGVYAFAYWKGNTIALARDLIGVKPLHFSWNKDTFAFSSEAKVLESLNYLDIQELNPRTILYYDTQAKTLKKEEQGFFTTKPEHSQEKEEIKLKTKELLDSAIQKRIPEKQVALLFSGGIDSTFIAKTLKEKGVDFTAYTAVLDTEHAEPADLAPAIKVAEELKLNHKIIKIKQEEIPQYLKHIVPLIEDSNVVKVGVALTFYLAAQAAKKDGNKVIFSGLGSEEIFAGYQRHRQANHINEECLAGLRKIYERDLYRDDVLTMDNNLELRLPFLDKELVEYALKIPEQYKLNEDFGKVILREIAEEKGISKEFAWRKKKAAQYGSRFDSAIQKLAKQNDFSSKSAYLRTFYPKHNLKLGVLFSSGKDSTRAAQIMKEQNYQLACLITMKSKNPFSYMFQTAGTELTDLQAEAMDIPIITQTTMGNKEEELEDLKKAIQKAKEHYNIGGIVTGALFSRYQRDRIEAIAESLNLKVFSPLWHKSQLQHMQEVLSNNYKIILTVVAAEGLNKDWLNKVITQEDVNKLEQLNKDLGVNIAGEGGEFESLTLNCPLFKKEIKIEEAEIVEDNNSAYLKIKKATLLENNNH